MNIGRMHETHDDIARLLASLRSTNPELQHNGLKDLMFVSTGSSVSAFLEPGNIKLLIELSGSSNSRVESSALRLLWHLSAQAEMKGVMYEEGVFGRIKNVMSKENPEDYLACAAILQNISEHRFLKGEINPNQVKLVNDGILECICSRMKVEDKRVQFLSCLTVCNLSMNDENHKKIEKSGLLKNVQQFVLDNQLHVDMVCHWLTLQPHIPLLHSKFVQVQLFGVSSLLVLVKNDQYRVEVWRCMSMNGGVGILSTLAKSPDATISKLANDVIRILQLAEPLVKTTNCDVGSYLGKMFDNPEFSDVKFVCNGGVLHGHKAILAARCPQFHAMFTHFRESRQDEIHIPDETMDYATLRIVLEFIYTGVSRGVTCANAVEVLAAAEMYALPELKQHCEQFLWHYVDAENAAQLYRAASLYAAPQLLRACGDFLMRNFPRVEKGEGFGTLPQEGKEEIVNMLKERINPASVDSQGKLEVKEGGEGDFMDEERVVV